MAQLLRINATDRRITTSGIWNRNNDTTLTCLYTECGFFLLFRGTGIKLFCGYEGNVTLDISFHGGPGMEDGDHQLMVNANSGREPFFMSHVEIENASGDGFDLLSAGPNAQNVPAQALTVDNIDPAIIYHSQSQWLFTGTVGNDYGGSLSYTSTPGASLSFSFDGVAIWLYGHMCAPCGSFKISIDSLTPQRLNMSSNSSKSLDSYDLVQRMIWSNTTLDPGRHTLNITYDENSGSAVFLDFFRVLLGAGTSTLSSFSTTNLGESPTTVPPIPPTNQNQTNRVPLVVGLTLGLLVLAVIALCGVRHIHLRRGRRSIDAHSVSPFTGPPIRRSDQRSCIPPVLKGVPQPVRPPGAPMATVDPSLSSSETGLGPPPSYETLSYDWRVDTAQ